MAYLEFFSILLVEVFSLFSLLHREVRGQRWLQEEIIVGGDYCHSWDFQ